MITHERLCDLLAYNPDTGTFTARVSRYKWRVGQEVGTTTMQGYRQIAVDGKLYKAHRLAWFWVTGEWPSKGLDHINRQRDDNRILNLREASQAENLQNRKAAGCYFHKTNRNWVAQIKVNQKVQHIGVFASKEEAHAAYRAAKTAVHTFNPTL
jgi:hypothetical protein